MDDMDNLTDLEIEVATAARLFGLINSNRDFSAADSWGKNQFNSSFPAALCCYMASIGMDANYLRTSSGKLGIGSLGIAEVFGSEPLAKTTHFSFEIAYEAYEKFASGDTPRTDLVITTTEKPQRQTAALEVKLTAIPDSATHMLDDSEYGAELVIRPDTIFYLAAGLSSDNRTKLKYVFQTDGVSISSWDSARAVLAQYPKIHAALKEIAIDEEVVQRPSILQPIWKTEGRSPRLAEHCLDLFVWSTVGFLYFVLDIAQPSEQTRFTRPMRTVVWTYKMLRDIAMNGSTNFQSTIDSLTYGVKNDKAFSAAGGVTHKYMKHQNLTKPRIKKSEIKSIILGGGQDLLSPERRFDAIIVNSPEIFS